MSIFFFKDVIEVFFIPSENSFLKHPHFSDENKYLRTFKIILHPPFFILTIKLGSRNQIFSYLNGFLASLCRLKKIRPSNRQNRRLEIQIVNIQITFNKKPI